MQKETIIAQELTSYSMIEQFDTACCRLLANKPILAWLLRDTVKDYQDYSIEEIMDCLEDSPQVRAVAVDQDVKNQETGKIVGDSTADKSVTEGVVLYDILFTSRLPKTNETCQIIVNVENQNRWKPGYPLLKRAVYYSSRLISRQKEKRGILEQEYHIPMTVEMKKEADTMCTYGQSILEEGMEKGMRQGMQKGMQKGRQEEREANVLAMLKEKIPMETISRITHYSLDQIQKLGKLHGIL